MSAIFGIFHKDDAPVDPDHLAAMDLALAHRGVDGNGCWRQRCIGLGHRMFWSTPESVQEKLPVTTSSQDVVLTADAQLDNREELAARLGMTIDVTVSDSQLVLAAYQRWGDQFVAHMTGLFAIAVWDQSKRKLYLVTDHLGLSPIYYFQTPDRFIFASEVKGILAIPDVPRRLDHRKMAQLAISSAAPVDNSRTYFEGIRKIAPAAVMTVEDRYSQTGDGTHTRQYWTLDPTKRIVHKNETDYLEEFRHIWFRAVGDKMRSAFPVASLLSGGLDSSSVVTTASHLIEQSGQELTTFSAVLPDNARSGLIDEREYIDLFRDRPNLNMAYITERQRGPFDDVGALVHGGDRPTFTSRHYLYSAFSQAARERGIRTILDGTGGEFGPTFHGHGYLAELFRQKNWRTLIRETRLGALRQNRSVLSLYKSQVLKPLLPDCLLDRLGYRNNGSISNWLSQQPFRMDYVTKHLDNLDKQVSSVRSYGKSRPDHRENMVRAFESIWGSMELGGFVGSEQVHVAFPFGNIALLEYALAIPGSLKVNNGYSRYLMRAGLDGFLPPKIQWRTSKQPFSPDFSIRYNRDRVQVQALLDGLASNDPILEVLDIPKLRIYAQHQIKDNWARSPADFTAMHLVPLGVYTIAFVRQFADFSP